MPKQHPAAKSLPGDTRNYSWPAAATARFRLFTQIDISYCYSGFKSTGDGLNPAFPLQILMNL